MRSWLWILIMSIQWLVFPLCYGEEDNWSSVSDDKNESLTDYKVASREGDIENTEAEQKDTDEDTLDQVAKESDGASEEMQLASLSSDFLAGKNKDINWKMNPFGKPITDPDALNAVLGGKLAGLGQAIVDIGENHGIDPGLLAAIAMHESANGTRFIFSNENPLGIAGGYKSFASIPDSFDYIANQMENGKVYGAARQANTITRLGRTYAEDPNWPRAVTNWYNKILKNTRS